MNVWLLSKPSTDKDFAVSSGNILLCWNLFTPYTLALILNWTFPAAMLFQNYFSYPEGKWNLFILFHFAAAFHIVQDLEENSSNFPFSRWNTTSSLNLLSSVIFSRSLIVIFTFLFNQASSSLQSVPQIDTVPQERSYKCG